MKRHLILLFVGVSLPFLLAAQQKNSVSITKRVLRIPEVTVVGKRPMKDIGVQRTRFDSIAMKENIALSMADVLTFNSSVMPSIGLLMRIPFHVTWVCEGEVPRKATVDNVARP